jgi:long-chain fatty acid transport protein
VTIDVDRNWHDTWRGAIGFEYRMTEEWLLRGGFSYDSSPVDADHLLPDIPVGEQYRFSLGIQHDFGDGKVFAFNYTLLYTDIDVDNVALPSDGTVVLDGDYGDSFIHLAGASLSISF